jgi:hypothetical protein
MLSKKSFCVAVGAAIPQLCVGEASQSDELTGEFGNWPDGISTRNRRLFRLSAGN